MMNCQSCKHWTETEGLVGGEEGWRECRMGRGEQLNKKAAVALQFHPRSLMRASAGGAPAAIVTGPLHYCSHWDGVL
jgi:hypothetical protein